MNGGCAVSRIRGAKPVIPRLGELLPRRALHNLGGLRFADSGMSVGNSKARAPQRVCQWPADHPVRNRFNHHTVPDVDHGMADLAAGCKARKSMHCPPISGLRGEEFAYSCECSQTSASSRFSSQSGRPTPFRLLPDCFETRASASLIGPVPMPLWFVHMT